MSENVVTNVGSDGGKGSLPRITSIDPLLNHQVNTFGAYSKVTTLQLDSIVCQTGHLSVSEKTLRKH